MGAKQTKLSSSASIATSLNTAAAYGHHDVVNYNAVSKVKRRKSGNQTVQTNNGGYAATGNNHQAAMPKSTSTHTGLNWRHSNHHQMPPEPSHEQVAANQYAQTPQKLSVVNGGGSSSGSTPVSTSSKSSSSRHSGSLQRGLVNQENVGNQFYQTSNPADRRQQQRGGQEQQPTRPYSTLPRPLTVQTKAVGATPAAAPASPLIPILNQSPVPLIRSMTPGRNKAAAVENNHGHDRSPKPNGLNPSPRLEKRTPAKPPAEPLKPQQISPASTNTTTLMSNANQHATNTPLRQLDTDSNNTSNSNSSTKKASKIAKRFGLSPRFKRKIVETIANKMGGNGAGDHQNPPVFGGSTHFTHKTAQQQQKLNHSSSLANLNKSNNNIYGNSNSLKSGAFFSQSRLLQAFHSQWNLFSSIRYSSKPNHLNRDPVDTDDDADIADDWILLRRSKRGRNRERYTAMANGSAKRGHNDSTATFLSTSLQRNSFRYVSRRKYKTQSLANPFRHANTNYPVYIHEALFLPEFSVKGQVTEADFEILDVISRGAFGHVIKVRKKSTDEQDEEQIYAMKIMWKSQVIRDRALQQVKDEVTIATNCVDNPLIVKTWYYWQSKRFLYIITDFVENGELLSLWLKVHHFPERLVTLYAVEMSLVLDYLHKRGIIYRDIKMENILLDQRGHVQLIDFGLSKWLPMGERTGTICGTIQYMAPEILGVEPYDHAVDWWSLGILVYALLSGEYPLNAAKDHIQMNEKVSKHVFELDNRYGEHSQDACDIVRKLLRKSPHRRLKSLSEIKRDPFFLKEVDNFVNAYLIEEKKMLLKQRKQQLNQPLDGETDDNLDLLLTVSEDERRMLSENFWNPYVIMQNYSPLQMLYDEIYAIKQRQKQEQEQEELRLREQALQQKKSNRHSTKKSVAKSNLVMVESMSTLPSPPPPPPPPPAPQASNLPSFPNVVQNCVSTSTTATTSTMSSSNKSTIDDDGSNLDYSNDEDEVLNSSNTDHSTGGGEELANARRASMMVAEQNRINQLRSEEVEFIDQEALIAAAAGGKNMISNVNPAFNDNESDSEELEEYQHERAAARLELDDEATSFTNF